MGGEATRYCYADEKMLISIWFNFIQMPTVKNKTKTKQNCVTCKQLKDKRKHIKSNAPSWQPKQWNNIGDVMNHFPRVKDLFDYVVTEFEGCLYESNLQTNGLQNKGYWFCYSNGIENVFIYSLFQK